jgi:CMD domain protein
VQLGSTAASAGAAFYRAFRHQGGSGTGLEIRHADKGSRMSDVIDHLAGIAPGSRLDALRQAHPIARQHAQASHDALLAPRSDAGFSRAERFAVAAFVAGLHAAPEAVAFYSTRLAELPGGVELAALVRVEVDHGRTAGPYGRYPAGPLSAEDQEGPVYLPDPALPKRLGAAFAHAHLLVFHLRDASADALHALERAGWSADGIVSLSQLVAFLAYQIRAAQGLRVLAAS